ncbi:putative autophagy-related 12 variant 1 [Besnoitia besnoiti]|uniref:Ubiquitin-like protein ATG12 n=1 Tax=Besnoitia besnoiti TaxID=94643 RepID=A0A2A9MAY6_BESBE|nr:putative autophagy-related 12 variant 1 [Besnoitia besnoiti]PFH32552.1 putative autophagy-related 12 variant 1 [Besnoitia besnoiti]
MVPDSPPSSDLSAAYAGQRGVERIALPARVTACQLGVAPHEAEDGAPLAAGFAILATSSGHFIDPSSGRFVLSESDQGDLEELEAISSSTSSSGNDDASLLQSDSGRQSPSLLDSRSELGGLAAEDEFFRVEETSGSEGPFPAFRGAECRAAARRSLDFCDSPRAQDREDAERSRAIEGDGGAACSGEPAEGLRPRGSRPAGPRGEDGECAAHAPEEDFRSPVGGSGAGRSSVQKPGAGQEEVMGSASPGPAPSVPPSGVACEAVRVRAAGTPSRREEKRDFEADSQPPSAEAGRRPSPAFEPRTFAALPKSGRGGGAPRPHASGAAAAESGEVEADGDRPRSAGAQSQLAHVPRVAGSGGREEEGSEDEEEFESPQEDLDSHSAGDSSVARGGTPSSDSLAGRGGDASAAASLFEGGERPRALPSLERTRRAAGLPEGDFPRDAATSEPHATDASAAGCAEPRKHRGSAASRVMPPSSCYESDTECAELSAHAGGGECAAGHAAHAAARALQPSGAPDCAAAARKPRDRHEARNQRNVSGERETMTASEADEACPHGGCRRHEGDLQLCWEPQFDAAWSVETHLVGLRDFKVHICLSNVGGAARLRVSRFKVDAYQRFDAVISFLKKALKKDLLYVYVNNFIQPQPDEFVADLFKAFGVGGSLMVSYCYTPAY